MAHALVHAADQHHQRRARGQCQIAVGRKPESERNRHAGKDAEAGHADKEDDQIEIAERLQRAPEQPEDRDDEPDRQDRSQHGPTIARSGQPQEGKQRHQRDADRQSCGTPAIGDLQCRRGDVTFFVGVFPGRPGNQKQKRQRGCRRHQIEIGAHGGLRAGDHRRHPHVFGAAECDRGAQHREPQEQDRRQFVRPDQWPVQRIARHHAGKQDDDLGDDQKRRRNLDQHSQRMFDRRQQLMAARGLTRLAATSFNHSGMSHDGLQMLRTACRRTFRAAPRPGRRIYLSIPRRIRPSAASHGTAPRWAG